MTWAPWCAAWQSALYRPGTGFYRRERAEAHFATSVASLPAGARILADTLLGIAEGADIEVIVEVGCGSGALLSQLSSARPGCRVIGIDVHSRPGGLPDTVEWLRTSGGSRLPSFSPLRMQTDARLREALIVAHEWLDVVPCPVLQVDGLGAPRVVEVEAATGNERLGGDPDPRDLEWCARYWPTDGLPPGARIEVGRTRDDAWARVLDRLASGVAVAVDYGHLVTGRPVGGTLTGYAAGRRVLPRPDGRCDITAHVAADSLEHDELLTQRAALRRCGLARGMPDPAAATADPRGYLASLADAATAAALADPAGPGSFLWAVTRR